jgi:glucan phosphorylase
MHPYYTTSFADREMFAYNKQQAELKRVLAQPEQRMKYAFEFLSGYIGNDELMAAKCYDAIAKYSAQLDYSEAHF